MKQFLNYEDMMHKLFSSEEQKIKFIDDENNEMIQTTEFPQRCETTSEEPIEKTSMIVESKGEILTTEELMEAKEEVSLEVMQAREEASLEEAKEIPIEIAQVKEEPEVMPITEDSLATMQTTEETLEIIQVKEEPLELTKAKEDSLKIMPITEDSPEVIQEKEKTLEVLQVAEEAIKAVPITEELMEVSQVKEELIEVMQLKEEPIGTIPIIEKLNQENCGEVNLLKSLKQEKQEILSDSDINKSLDIQKEDEERENFSIGDNKAIVPIPIYPTNVYEVIKTPIIEKDTIAKDTQVSPDNNTKPLRAVNHAKVRIMNAAANYAPISVSIGNKMVSSDLPFGKVSDYTRIIDGYRTVIVSNAETSIPLAHIVFPFIAGTKLTLVVTSTANGLTIVQVSDDVCKNKLEDRSCFRVANFSFENGPFDITLSNGCIVFSDIMVKEDTPFKQAVPGDYDFFVMNTIYETNSNELAGIKEVNKRDINSRILDFFVKINANTIYTAYIIGGYYNVVPLQVIVVEN